MVIITKAILMFFCLRLRVILTKLSDGHFPFSVDFELVDQQFEEKNRCAQLLPPYGVALVSFFYIPRGMWLSKIC